MSDYTLAELLIVAAAEAWRGNGEVLASGIGVVPRLGAGLAKLTHTPELLMTDSEAYLVEDPIPLGPRGDWQPRFSGYMPFERVFDCLWAGRRHVMISPVQIDRFGQANLSAIGPAARPKAMMLGVRGLPGNSINHMNSMFIAAHSKRVFVENEVDIVGGAGYNNERWPHGVRRDFVCLERIVTDLCVMDFAGVDRAIRVRSLHPGISFEQVQAATGFSLEHPAVLDVTAAPTSAQLEVIRRLDPHGQRASVIKGNPPGERAN
jgi:glutaconate CoA-transferase, subunit B